MSYKEQILKKPFWKGSKKLLLNERIPSMSLTVCKVLKSKKKIVSKPGTKIEKSLKKKLMNQRMMIIS